LVTNQQTLLSSLEKSTFSTQSVDNSHSAMEFKNGIKSTAINYIILSRSVIVVLMKTD